MGKEPSDYRRLITTVSPLQPIGPHLDSSSNKTKKNYRQLGKSGPVWTVNAKVLFLICAVFKGRNLDLLETHTETYTDEIVRYLGFASK